MARIETYRVGPLEITPPRKQTVIDIRGFAQGVGAVGGAIAEYANSMRIADRQEKQIEIDNYFIDERLRISTLKGKNAVGELQKFEENRERFIQSRLDREENPRTREELDIHINQRVGQHRQWVARYEFEQGDIYRQQMDTDWRNNAQKKLIGIAIGDTKSIDQQVEDSVAAAKEREGVNRWSSALESNYRQAVRDEFYYNKITSWYKEAPDEAYQWFEKEKEAIQKKVSLQVYNQLKQVHKVKKDDAAVDRLYGKTFAKYGTDFLGASLALAANPTKEGQAVSNRMYSNYLRQKAQDETVRKERREGLAQQINQYFSDITAIEDPVTRNQSYNDLVRAINESTEFTIEEKAQLAANISKANLRIVPEKVKQIYNQIENGTINEESDIVMHIGNGIGTNIQPFVSRLNRRKSLEAKGNIDYYKDALRDFDAIVKMVTPKARRAAFEEGGNIAVLIESDKTIFKKQLQAFMQQNDLSNYDPRVREEASRMLINQNKKVEGWARFVAAFTGESTETGGYTFKMEAEQAAETEAQTESGAIRPAIATEQEFDRLRANPDAIPGETPDDKAMYLRNIYENATGRLMLDEVYQQLKQEIESGR